MPVLLNRLTEYAIAGSDKLPVLLQDLEGIRASPPLHT